MANKDNPATGRKFETMVERFLYRKGIRVLINDKLENEQKITVLIGKRGGFKKEHQFDLISKDKLVLVECKCHSWTKSRGCSVQG